MSNATPPVDFQQLRHFVVFLGNPRAGTTLVRSLLNAHPDVIIANELDVMGMVRAGANLDSMLAAIVANEARFERDPVWTGYKYAIDASNPIEARMPLVVGDKKAGLTTREASADSSLITRLAERVHPLTIKVIRCIRNPLDCITTRAMRLDEPLELHVSRYFEVEEMAERLVGRPELVDAHRVYLEQLIRSPVEGIDGALQFLGLRTPPGYVEACRALIADRSRRTRNLLQWPEQTLSEARRRTAEMAHLAVYRDDMSMARD